MRSLATWSISWPFGETGVLATGGILWDCRFRLPSERWIAPFAACPWAKEGAGEDSPEMRAQPGHMRWLGGEFPCLPFGVGGAVREPAPAWRHLFDGRVNDPPHGPAANADWTLAAATPSSIELTLDYPAGHDIARLTRRIAGVADRPALDLALVIEARRDCAWPVGLHPILALPKRPGALRLEAAFAVGLTYPGIVEPNAMLTLPGQSFGDLRSVPAPGGLVDLSRLPADRPAEDVVQLFDVAGPVRAVYADDGYAITVDWDRALLPSCQIWISDRALQSFPWRGRFRGLGIEPTASAFDFAHPVSQAATPIGAMGYPTVVRIAAGTPLTIRYRIEAAELG